MENLLSLTKIGNIKIGKQINGNPLALEKILVTRATKENDENFQVYPGFDREGISELEVTLPFNDIDLNFEVNFVAFLEIDSIDYIAKAPEKNEDIILYPLHPENFNLPLLNMGKLTEKIIEDYKFKYTGFLKVMIPEISGFGEVFYFKTSGLNTIRAIRDQLIITKKLLNDNLANIPLILKPVKKDLQDGTQIVFLSIAYDIIDLFTLKEDIALAEILKKGIESIEIEYLNLRENNEIKDIDKKSKIVINTKDNIEILSVEDKNNYLNNLLDKENITDITEREAIIGLKTTLPMSLILKYFKVVKGIEGSEYLEVFKREMTDGITPPEMLSKISEYNKR